MKESSLRRLIHMISLEKQFQREERPLHSEEIGGFLNTTGDSIRKDLSLGLGREKKSRGHYGKRSLGKDIRSSLGLDVPQKICLVGLGHLGQFLLEQIRTWEAVQLVVLFDTQINRLERLDSSIPAYPAWEIPEIVPSLSVTRAILATDPEESEKNALRLVDGGVTSILNLSGYYLSREIGDVEIANINFFTELLALSARTIDRAGKPDQGV